MVLPNLLVTVVSLVLSHLHPGAEAVRTEGQVTLSALDPHHTGLVDVITTTSTQKLLTEVQRHPPLSPPPSYYFKLELSPSPTNANVHCYCKHRTVLLNNNNN